LDRTNVNSVVMHRDLENKRMIDPEFHQCGPTSRRWEVTGGSRRSSTCRFSLPRTGFVHCFYLPIAILSIVLDHPLKPPDPIQKHRNEHSPVDFDEYLAYHTFYALPSGEWIPCSFCLRKSGKEVTWGQVWAIGRLRHPPSFRGPETISRPA
jgi:hypothetical protein